MQVKQTNTQIYHSNIKNMKHTGQKQHLLVNDCHYRTCNIPLFFALSGEDNLIGFNRMSNHKN